MVTSSRSSLVRATLAALFIQLAFAATATAQPADAGALPASPVDAAPPALLAKRLANPLSDMVSIPVQLNWVNGVGPEKDLRYVVNVQPVMPFSIAPRWNVIGRVVMPFISQPAALGSSSGSGDIVASAFFSPKDGPGGLIWGIGPVASLPTSTDPTLGSGTWAAGPTAIVMKQHGALTIGALVNQLWSFAATSTVNRPDVSQMLFQPVVSLVTPAGVTFTLVSEMTANWRAAEGDVWTVPLMGMVSRITRMGPLPVSLQAGGGVYLAAPEGGPRWQLRTGVVVILPKRR